MFQFIKTTVIGGLMFLLPIVVLYSILKQAHKSINKISAPILSMLPEERVFGVAMQDLLVVAVVVLICFLAGPVARSNLAMRLVTSLETQYLSRLPPYEDAKTKMSARLFFDKAKTKTKDEDARWDMQPVLARFDDRWQIAFEVERIIGGKVSIFVPGAPDPWAGSVYIMTDDRISRLDSDPTATLNVLKQLGKGASGHVQSCINGS